MNEDAHSKYFQATCHQIGASFLTGVKISTSSGPKTVKAAIIMFSCDLPARAMILNMRQFNGKHGCHLCNDEGQTSASNPLLRWWPYKNSQTMRTKKSLLQSSAQATMSGVIVSYQLFTILYLNHFYLVHWDERFDCSCHTSSPRHLPRCSDRFPPLCILGGNPKVIDPVV